MTESGGRENAHAKIGLGGGRILPEKYLDIKVFVFKASVFIAWYQTVFFQVPISSFRSSLYYTIARSRVPSMGKWKGGAC